jgi:hypothetical protein
VVDVNISQDVNFGIPGFETLTFGRQEKMAGGTNPTTIKRVVADALVTGQDLREYTVVKLNADSELDVYTYADFENGDKPYGITAIFVEEGNLGQSIPVAIAGEFNAEAVVFDESFETNNATLDEKINAFVFEGSNIVLRKLMYQGV